MSAELVAKMRIGILKKACTKRGVVKNVTPKLHSSTTVPVLYDSIFFFRLCLFVLCGQSKSGVAKCRSGNSQRSLHEKISLAITLLQKFDWCILWVICDICIRILCSRVRWDSNVAQNSNPRPTAVIAAFDGRAIFSPLAVNRISSTILL